MPFYFSFSLNFQQSRCCSTWRRLQRSCRQWMRGRRGLWRSATAQPGSVAALWRSVIGCLHSRPPVGEEQRAFAEGLPSHWRRCACVGGRAEQAKTAAWKSLRLERRKSLRLERRRWRRRCVRLDTVPTRLGNEPLHGLQVASQVVGWEARRESYRRPTARHLASSRLRTAGPISVPSSTAQVRKPTPRPALYLPLLSRHDGLKARLAAAALLFPGPCEIVPCR